MVVGIVSDETYQKDFIVKDVLNGIYNRLGKFFTVASGGNRSGAENVAKRYALKEGLKYHSFNPAYTGYQMYSYKSKDYYKKKYHNSHVFKRYTDLVKFCDVIIIFKEEGIELSPQILNAIKWAKRLKRKVYIIN